MQLPSPLIVRVAGRQNAAATPWRKHDRFVCPRGGPFDTEEMHQYSDAALSRLKAYIEAAESRDQPAVVATLNGHSRRSSMNSLPRTQSKTTCCA